MSYQKLIVVGNLGRDPEMRYLPNGKPVTNFNLASNRSYTNSNGEKVKEHGPSFMRECRNLVTTRSNYYCKKD